MRDTKRVSFSEEFVWGAATASYQIEGAANEDGRSESVWDMMCRKPGAVFEGHNGDVACDHYHRYPEDVALLKQLGAGAYRFSVAWPRVIPGGTGTVNEKGLDFYDRLVDALLGAGIDPWVTLYHWDLPTSLYHRGGWLNPDISHWFADYTAAVVDKLGDRVSNWFTLNEPSIFIGLGMWYGTHAPGDKLRWAEVIHAAHNSHVAHGRAVQVIRARAQKTPKVGIAPTIAPAIPLTDSPEDVEAARQATFSVTQRDPWQHSWWLDPIFLGSYPKDGLELYGNEAPVFPDSDWDVIAQPLDFFGFNIYQGFYVKAGADGKPQRVANKPGAPVTALKWPVTPEALYWGPKFMAERYGNRPIYITENGLANQDWVGLDGQVHDPQRIDFLRRYLREFRRAAEDGVPCAGYFHWSLMDNFEWAEGYRERFGLVHVDYETQKRTPKDSFAWFAQVIRENGAEL